MEYTREEKYWIWLYSIEGVGVKNFTKLLAYFGSALSVYENAKSDELKKVVGQALAGRIIDSIDKSYAKSKLEELERKEITAICRTSEFYPKNLLSIYDPPIIIFAKGNLDVLKNEDDIAIVGTRKCTEYGKRSAQILAKDLSDAGMTIVSGMASGIDSFAHRGCLEGNSPTVAVLGCGVDIIYPSSNNLLYERIKQNGVIISEYWPGTPPKPTTFPARNRIISGISNGVVVIEAPEKSGALITVEYALDQGRDVFATPGSISSRASGGTNKLLQEGAKLVISADDILCEYGLQTPDIKTNTKKDFEFDIKDFSEQEIMIINSLGTAEYTYDELYGAISPNYRLEFGDFGAALTMLELKGIIKQLPGNVYTINIK